MGAWMVRVTGGERVAKAIRGKSLKGRVKLRLEVGYATPYAVRVHEDLTARHPNGGQAKYLEAPARRLDRQMRQTVREYLLRRRSLQDGLMRAGRDLLAASRPLVPVDTRRLQNSGYVEVR